MILCLYELNYRGNESRYLHLFCLFLNWNGWCKNVPRLFSMSQNPHLGSSVFLCMLHIERQKKGGRLLIHSLFARNPIYIQNALVRKTKSRRLCPERVYLQTSTINITPDGLVALEDRCPTDYNIVQDGALDFQWLSSAVSLQDK